MALSVAELSKAMKDLSDNLSEMVLDNQRILLADLETKFNSLSAQVQLLLSKSDNGGSGGSAEKKAPKRVTAATAAATTENTTESTSTYPNMVGLSDARVKAIKSLGIRGNRAIFMKNRAAVDLAYYNEIPESFRTEHENSAKAEKAKKGGEETLREFVAAQWWDHNKADKDFLNIVKKQMDEWIAFMNETTAAAPSAAMENE